MPSTIRLIHKLPDAPLITDHIMRRDLRPRITQPLNRRLRALHRRVVDDDQMRRVLPCARAKIRGSAVSDVHIHVIPLILSRLKPQMAHPRRRHQGRFDLEPSGGFAVLSGSAETARVSSAGGVVFIKNYVAEMYPSAEFGRLVLEW